MPAQKPLDSSDTAVITVQVETSRLARRDIATGKSRQHDWAELTARLAHPPLSPRTLALHTTPRAPPWTLTPKHPCLP